MLALWCYPFFFFFLRPGTEVSGVQGKLWAEGLEWLFLVGRALCLFSNSYAGMKYEGDWAK